MSRRADSTISRISERESVPFPGCGRNVTITSPIFTLRVWFTAGRLALVLMPFFVMTDANRLAQFCQQAKSQVAPLAEPPFEFFERDAFHFAVAIIAPALLQSFLMPARNLGTVIHAGLPQFVGKLHAPAFRQTSQIRKISEAHDSAKMLSALTRSKSDCSMYIVE